MRALVHRSHVFSRDNDLMASNGFTMYMTLASRVGFLVFVMSSTINVPFLNPENVYVKSRFQS